ncbi:hypothetical protein Tco_0477418 [Tanacetum coccineum]
MSCTAQSLLLFIHQVVGYPGAAWAIAGEGRAPFDMGFFAGNENADPADMGTAEQHQNIARRESEGKINKKCHKTTGNAIGSDRLLASLSDSCALRGEPASSGVAFHPKHTTAIVLLLPLLTSKRKGVKLNASLAHSERISALAEVEKGEEGTHRLREEALREQGASLSLSERPIEREAVNQLSGLGLLVSEGCFGKAYEQLSFNGRSIAWYGIKSNPSCLVNKQRDQVRTELRMTELSSLPLAGLLAKTDPPPTTLYGLVSEATEYSYLLCSVDSSAHSAYDSYPIASSCSLSAGVKDGSSSSSALLAASSQLSSKRWFARAIVRISSTMSTESSTRNHFFDILEKIKQFRVSKLMVVTVGSSPKCIKTLGSTIPRPALGCVKPRADTNKSVPLIPPNTEPPKGRPVPTSKIVRAKERVNLVFGSMPIVDHVVSFPMESEGAVDGREIIGLSSSIVGKLSSLKRIDQQATLHAVTIEEIRVEISESSLLHPYISSISLAKKNQRSQVPWASSEVSS